MKTPIFVRPLSEEEQESLKKGLRSKDTFAMRRSHSLDAGQAVDNLPGPPIRAKKRRRDRLMEIASANPEAWAVGFEDECWCSRVALPTLNGWGADGEPLRLIQRSVAKEDSEPKAISC